MTPEQLETIRGHIRIYDNRVAERDVVELLHESDSLQAIIDTHTNHECFTGPTGDLATADGSVFEELVAEMRAAQKLCEQRRRPANSIIKRGMEEQVDQELARIKSEATP